MSRRTIICYNREPLTTEGIKVMTRDDDVALIPFGYYVREMRVKVLPKYNVEHTLWTRNVDQTDQEVLENVVITLRTDPPTESTTLAVFEQLPVGDEQSVTPQQTVYSRDRLVTVAADTDTSRTDTSRTICVTLKIKKYRT